MMKYSLVMLVALTTAGFSSDGVKEFSHHNSAHERPEKVERPEKPEKPERKERIWEASLAPPSFASKA